LIRARHFSIGLALAGTVWVAAFRGRSGFWPKMTVGVGSLGAYALAVNPDLRRQGPRPRDALVGGITAAALYGVFRAGDLFARRVMPMGANEIEAVYTRRREAPRWFIASALAFVIAPGEELFWRGLVNGYLMQRLGRVFGSAVGACLYGGIHLVTGNLTLTGAAWVAGAFWSLQYLFERRLPSLILSHAAWDLAIFLVGPTVRLED
jgi:membrane protease YdiL (CAAX protease family)